MLPGACHYEGSGTCRTEELQMATRTLLAAATLAALLAACGGDSTPAPAQPGTPPPPSVAQINGTNYLDAFAVGSLGGVRLLYVADAVDSAFAVVVEANDAPGTYACDAGGTVTFVKAGAARTLTVNNCNDGVMTYVSGTLSSPNAVAGTFGSLMLLQSGDFTASNVVYRLNGDAVNDTLNGTFNMQRRTNLSIVATGAFTVQRNGRTDTYSAVRAESTPPDASGMVDISLMSYSVTSPRFPVPLAVTGNETSLVASAPDTSSVTAKDASSGTTFALTFEVRSSPTAAPSVTQTLTATDPQLVAAMARALQ
jgi:hypothetical protein